jgi:hypothetical protein
MTLLVSLLGVMLLSALGSALLLATMAETQITASFGRAAEAFYAADGAMERAIQDLDGLPNWSGVLDGSVASSFVDGVPSGQRVLPGGGTIDLNALTNTVRCGKSAGCTPSDLDRVTADRPWGVNNPRWQLFACGPFNALLMDDTVRSPTYVLVWAGDDPAEFDGMPLVDGGPNVDGSANAGRDVVVLLAQAYGPSGSRRVVEATVARLDTGHVRVLAWRELRQ